MYSDKKAIMKKNPPLRGNFSAAFKQQHREDLFHNISHNLVFIILKLLETPTTVAGGFTNVCFSSSNN